MESNINVREMVDELIKETYENSLETQIKYMDWSKYRTKYPDILSNVLEVGVEHLRAIRLKDVPGWVTTVLFTTVLGLATDNAAEIVHLDADYSEAQFMSNAVELSKIIMKRNEEDQTKTYTVIDIKTNTEYLSIKFKFYHQEGDENYIHLDIYLQWNTRDYAMGYRILGFIISSMLPDVDWCFDKEE